MRFTRLDKDSFVLLLSNLGSVWLIPALEREENGVEGNFLS